MFHIYYYDNIDINRHTFYPHPFLFFNSQVCNSTHYRLLIYKTAFLGLFLLLAMGKQLLVICIILLLS